MGYGLRVAMGFGLPGKTMPDIGVFGDDPQGQLFTPTADENRKPACGRWIEPGEALLYARHGRVQVLEAAHRGAEFVAILPVVALEPAGTNAEDGPPAGNMIHRAGHVGEKLRIAIAVASYQWPDLNLFSCLRDGRKQRPALEMLATGVTRQGVEVIPDVDHVHTQRFGLLGGTPNVCVTGMLGMN